MTRLSEQLRTAPHRVGLRGLTAPTGLEKAAERIFRRWEGVVPTVREQDVEQILARMRERIRKDNWADTRLSEVTTAARAAFEESRLRRPDLSTIRQFFLAESSVSERKGLMGSMASIYLESFRPEAQHSRRLATNLAAAGSRLPARWQQLFSNLPELLDHAKGPDEVARRMAEVEDPYHMLNRAGLLSPHGTGFRVRPKSS